MSALASSDTMSCSWRGKKQVFKSSLSMGSGLCCSTFESSVELEVKFDITEDAPPDCVLEELEVLDVDRVRVTSVSAAVRSEFKGILRTCGK